MTYKDPPGTPSITIVNSNFTNIETGYNFYGFYSDTSISGPDKYVTPNGCSANPCTAFPYTGTCSVRSNTKQGVLCGCNCVGSANPVLESQLPPPINWCMCLSCQNGTYYSPISKACTDWTTCNAGTYISFHGSNASDRTCSPCANGRFSVSTNAQHCMRMKNCSAGTHIPPQDSTSDRNCSRCKNETFSNKTNANVCTPWSNCTKGTYVFFPGDHLSDRTCLSCGYGTFNNKTNAKNCMPWRNCTGGQGVSINQLSDGTLIVNNFHFKIFPNFTIKSRSTFLYPKTNFLSPLAKLKVS